MNEQDGPTLTGNYAQESSHDAEGIILLEKLIIFLKTKICKFLIIK